MVKTGAAINYVKVSSNGQVSIPAQVRARWGAERMLVVDMGDRIVVRPLLLDPVAELRGKYCGRGPNTDDARRRASAEDEVARHAR